MQCCSPLGQLLAGGRSHSQNGKGSIQQITPKQQSQQNNFNNMVPQLKINLESKFFKDTSATVTVIDNNGKPKELEKVDEIYAKNEVELIKCRESLKKSEKQNASLAQENAELRKMLNFMLQQKLI